MIFVAAAVVVLAFWMLIDAAHALYRCGYDDGWKAHREAGFLNPYAEGAGDAG